MWPASWLALFAAYSFGLQVFFVVWRCLCVVLLVNSFLGLKRIKLACCPSAGLDALLCEAGWHFDWEGWKELWFLGSARFCAMW